MSDPLRDARLFDAGLTRRQLLQRSLMVAGSAAAAGLTLRGSAAFGAPRGDAGVLDFTLEAAQTTYPLLPGQRTGMWRYRSVLNKGLTTWLTRGPAYFGPTIKVPQGTQVICRMRNALAEPHIVHWHGLEVAASADGHPKDAVGPGGEYTYKFIADTRPGTYWYHPHTDMRTGVQAYMGLAGLFIVTDPNDPDDAAKGLPSPARDLPIVLQDKLFNTASNALIFADPSNTFGMLGNRILVNGKPEATFTVDGAMHRLRILNGSNARIYKLAWSDGSPITIIASDGGLLGSIVTRPYLMVAPGERYEILADFRTKPAGASVTLRSLAFNAVIPGNSTLINGAAFDVCRFDIAATGPQTPGPEHVQLPLLTMHNPAQASGLVHPVTLGYVTGIPNCAPCWAINGRIYSMNEVHPSDVFKAGRLDVIELTNPISGPNMPHPMHWHGAHFQILSRERLTTSQTMYNTVKDGFCDAGWKDTVLIYPGERIRLLMRWTQHRGTYVYHCHNLEHEDHGMMLNYRVE
jgi:FtsP/CotA-like multicopper oxidase with cupredoxin domain